MEKEQPNLNLPISNSIFGKTIIQVGSSAQRSRKKLHEGLSAYNEGTKKLRAGTSGIDLQINDKIDKILENISGTGDKIVSFVSDKNTNISAVQFVLKPNP